MIYPNCDVDKEEEWAREYVVEGLPGATVFYQDKVRCFPLVWDI